MQRDAALFDAVLTPNRPLPRRWRGGVIVGGAAVISCAVSIGFVWRGAWPVTPFFGLDVGLLWFAFSASARAAKKREHLRLTHEALIIERIAVDGDCAREEINPYWLRVDHDDPEGVGKELALVSRGRRWVIGSFLGAEDRASLASALRQALYRVRNSYPSARSDARSINT